MCRNANVGVDRIPGDPNNLRLTLSKGPVSLSAEMSREEIDSLGRRLIAMADLRRSLELQKGC